MSRWQLLPAPADPSFQRRRCRRSLEKLWRSRSTEIVEIDRMQSSSPSFENEEGSRQSAQPMTYERSSTPLRPSEICSIPQLSPFATLPGGNCHSAVIAD